MKNILVTGADCGVGEVGEILVQGFNLMTAYYKLDVDEQPIDATGWLHTGDLGFFGRERLLALDRTNQRDDYSRWRKYLSR